MSRIVIKMIKILKIKYDDGRYWYSSQSKLKEILTDLYTPELFIIYLDENKEMSFCLLTDLQGEEVIIGNEIVKIPDTNEFLQLVHSSKFMVFCRER